MKVRIASYRNLAAIVMSVLIFLACMLLLPFHSVAAQNITGKPVKGLTLSPLRTEINISPGTSFNGALKVANSTDKPMTVDFSAEQFKVTNPQYDYEFIDKSDLSQWIAFSPSEVILKAGESKKVKFTVGAPLMAELGGYYISLFASTSVGPQTGSGDSVERVASLLYITVDSNVLGAVTRSGRLLSVSSPWLVVNSGTWNMMIQGVGMIHFRSNYTVGIDNLFGGTVVDKQGSALILPSTIRSVSEKLPLPKIPGLYKVIFKVGLGDRHDSVINRYMLFLPPWALLIIAIIITTAGFLLYKRLKRRR